MLLLNVKGGNDPFKIHMIVQIEFSQRAWGMSGKKAGYGQKRMAYLK